ncbi:MAG TPA: putative sulfate exporter family transporter [Polyangia bacterium]|nr:putative sulfate exporter family transporter [Polyangia bacterium]
MSETSATGTVRAATTHDAPRTGSIPGVALTAVIGAAALALQRVIPPSWALPDVLIALLLGSVVVNSPLGRWLGLAARDRGRNRYGTGLAFVGKNVLRWSVVLMGLRIQANLFQSKQLLALAVALAVALPTTFMVTRALAVPLRVPPRLADLIASGTMICGASAVNAVAPVIGARRQEQGVALATIFLYSAVALVLFRSIAALVGLTAHQAGIWSGLAVNDLASAVAVGAQMGPGGAEMAAASKSARVLMLAPVLILFSLARREEGQQTDVKRTILGHVPGFVLGFLALAIARAGADALWAGAPAWKAVLVIDKRVVLFGTVMVSSGIGLHLELKGLLSAGARAVVLGAIACSTMSGVTLAVTHLTAHGALGQLLVVCVVALAASYVALWTFRPSSIAAPPSAASRRHLVPSAALLANPLTASGAHRRALTGEQQIP